MKDIVFRKKWISELYQGIAVYPVVLKSFFELVEAFDMKNDVGMFLYGGVIVGTLLLKFILNKVLTRKVVFSVEGIRIGRQLHTWDRMLKFDYEERMVAEGTRFQRTIRMVHMKGAGYTESFDMNDIKKYVPQILEMTSRYQYIEIHPIIQNIAHNEEKKLAYGTKTDKMFVWMVGICLLVILWMIGITIMG